MISAPNMSDDYHGDVDDDDEVNAAGNEDDNGD